MGPELDHCPVLVFTPSPQPMIKLQPLQGAFLGLWPGQLGAAAGTRVCKACAWRPGPERSWGRQGGPGTHARAHTAYTNTCMQPGPSWAEVAGPEAGSLAAGAAGASGNKGRGGAGAAGPGRDWLLGAGGAGSGGDWPRPHRAPRGRNPSTELWPGTACTPPSAPGVGRRRGSGSCPTPPRLALLSLATCARNPTLTPPRAQLRAASPGTQAGRPGPPPSGDARRAESPAPEGRGAQVERGLGPRKLPLPRGWTGRGVREERTLREDKLGLKRVEAAVS